MKIIQHRINNFNRLSELNNSFGVELDLRYHNSDIILHHDPFSKGEKFEDFLKEFKLKFIILNIKSEGIEEEVLRLVQKYEAKDYFFLDSSIPFMVKYINKGWSKFAVRFSEYEPIELALKFKGKIEWVWVDCFTRFPLDKESYVQLKKHFKICLVSPELQGHPISMIEDFKKQIKGFDIDAVCTKHPDLWKI
tara:strand:+ start:1973 stop:2551 length:579 start_codon:yes stop_codon:yes gene_type:complete